MSDPTPAALAALEFKAQRVIRDGAEPWLCVADFTADGYTNDVASFLAACSPDVILALLAAARRGAGDTAPKPVKWLLERGDDGIHFVYAEEREQRDGTLLYAVTETGFTLNRDGEFEYEPQPSSRDDDYIARCRFASLDEAIATFRAARAAHPEGPQHETR